MSLEIKDLSSSERDLFSWSPDEPADVYFLLDIEIGEKGDQRRDLFYVTVATPEGLRANARGRDVIARRAVLVLSEFSMRVLRATVAEIVASCEAPTWSESCAKLERYFTWEYEDYRVDNEASTPQ
jgi:hypothetical protein